MEKTKISKYEDCPGIKKTILNGAKWYSYQTWKTTYTVRQQAPRLCKCHNTVSNVGCNTNMNVLQQPVYFLGYEVHNTLFTEQPCCLINY